MHRNDSKYYSKFCTLSGPRISDSKISDTVNINRNTKNSPGTPFGGFCLEKIQLFGFSLVPCHFILHIICTSHFLDKCTISHKRDFLSQSPRQKSRILKQFFLKTVNFSPSAWCPLLKPPVFENLSQFYQWNHLLFFVQRLLILFSHFYY